MSNDNTIPTWRGRWLTAGVSPPEPGRAAFEAYMDANAPRDWRTTAQARKAWRLWRAAVAAERQRCEQLCVIHRKSWPGDGPATADTIQFAIREA